ncbi:hypothetical protein BN85409610 [Alteracholeplasma palmae J233]|uniref:Uncharacterized protein n=1 Tax=Alteracholeplasma palmae (strain ATCC 49389 / J233) TaxID=1318466 RepID=U4KL92_ALTPJ|nr:hypothetical protein [Alteracholeplasma palmae]CCV64538.1 hypothetical protein BN85409610 [Alteracholeplasma palmae J233]
MKYILNFIKKYQDLNSKLNSRVTFKQTGLALIYALLTTVVIIAPFILITIQLFMFASLQWLWVTILFIFINLAVFSYFYFNYFYLKK